MNPDSRTSGVIAIVAVPGRGRVRIASRDSGSALSLVDGGCECSVEHVDVTAGESGDLAETEPAPGCDEHQSLVTLGNGRDDLGDLCGSRGAHLARLVLAGAFDGAGRRDDQACLDGGAETTPHRDRHDVRRAHVASRPACPPRRRPGNPRHDRRGGVHPLGDADPQHAPHGNRGPRPARRNDPCRRRGAPHVLVGEPRRARLHRPRDARRDQGPQPPRRVRLRVALLPGHVARPSRDPRDVRGAAASHPRDASLGGRRARRLPSAFAVGYETIPVEFASVRG